ncbi:hypothetical protein HELRODRAFT_178117 [Helobdella robusta]|uniref:Helicase/UvrB N-terminal domain-containing protein n=1 Tax=Helobdella robusta TaxID=6412 RepID=T1FCR7_HELRO|nr:hypothetical protein HELRODRAFT_178117 [Helobdella robusta]ESN97330.1 hypothetical protein HELRODRAFT_178117 [Helobdella robusta]
MHFVFCRLILLRINKKKKIKEQTHAALKRAQQSVDWSCEGIKSNWHEDAMKGRNYTIVAPTGTGKPHVAMHIIQDYLQQDNDGGDPRRKKCFVFLVPTVALVEQQKRLFVNTEPRKE